MKKFLFVFAAAVVAMAGCTKTEVVRSVDDAIRFETFFHKSTKAVESTAATLGQFTVTAKSESGADYIAEQTVQVAGDGSCYDYGNYYWPGNGAELDFYAWGPSISGQIVPDDIIFWCQFDVKPSNDPKEQIDFVVAKTNAKKSDGAVTFNFRHAMAQIAVKTFNGNKELKYVVSAWKVVNVDDSGTFNIQVSNTNGAGKLDYLSWSKNTNHTSSYTDTFASSETRSSTADETINNAKSFTNATTMIIVPQKTTMGSAYVGTTNTSSINGSYIALKMKILNAHDNSEIAPEQWCCWPVSFNLSPGYKYSYVIDLSQGGYLEYNDGDDSQPDKTALDKVLDDDAMISFATVTVDDLDPQTPSVSME